MAMYISTSGNTHAANQEASNGVPGCVISELSCHTNPKTRFNQSATFWSRSGSRWGSSRRSAGPGPTRMGSRMSNLPSSSVCCQRTWASMEGAPMNPPDTSFAHNVTSGRGRASSFIWRRIERTSFVSCSSLDRCCIGVPLAMGGKRQPWRSATILAASRAQVANTRQHALASASTWPSVIGLLSEHSQPASSASALSAATASGLHSSQVLTVPPARQCRLAWVTCSVCQTRARLVRDARISTSRSSGRRLHRLVLLVPTGSGRVRQSGGAVQLPRSRHLGHEEIAQLPREPERDDIASRV
eukprot:scaffold71024_cov60-Phaeocystis_antarctica.AAC.1